MFRSTVEWRRVSVRSLAAMALAAIQLLGADWPQWRGPNRDGVSRETGLLQQWPEAGPALKWKATGFGDGMGTVTIAGGRVYTTGDVGDTSWLFALNEADGTHLWKAKVGKSGSPGAAGHFYGGSRGIPSVDGDRLYLLSQLGELVSFTKDGKEVWRANLVRDHGGEVPTWGYSESPLVDGNQVIVTPGGFKGAMIAFEKNTGKVLWQSKGWTDAADYSSAIVTVIGGVRQYIQQSVPTVAGISRRMAVCYGRRNGRAVEL